MFPFWLLMRHWVQYETDWKDIYKPSDFPSKQGRPKLIKTPVALIKLTSFEMRRYRAEERGSTLDKSTVKRWLISCSLIERVSFQAIHCLTFMVAIHLFFKVLLDGLPSGLTRPQPQSASFGIFEKRKGEPHLDIAGNLSSYRRDEMMWIINFFEILV